jgi:hypothetical protein
MEVEARGGGAARLGQQQKQGHREEEDDVACHLCPHVRKKKMKTTWLINVGLERRGVGTNQGGLGSAAWLSLTRSRMSNGLVIVGEVLCGPDLMR